MVKWASTQGGYQKPTKADQRDDDLIITPKGKSSSKGVTKFAYYTTNPDTLLPQPEYEENEAPPQKLDSSCLEKLDQNGQFLFKNQVYNQEFIRIKREKDLAKI